MTSMGDSICDFLISVGIPVCFSVIFTKKDNICDFQGG